MYSGLVFRWPDGISIEAVTKSHIRFACWIKLPFRIRTGAFYQMSLNYEAGVEIWIHNRFAIPAGADHMELRSKRGATKLAGFEDYWSEALIIWTPPEIEDGFLDKIRREEPVGAPIELSFIAKRALNEFVCAYGTTLNSPFSGAPLRILSDEAFFDAVYAEPVVVIPPNSKLSIEQITEIVNWRPARDARVTGKLIGAVDDLPAEKTAAIGGVLDKVRDHLFYELAFMAKSQAVAFDDPITAIVLACAAMEGAHAAFLRQALAKTEVANTTKREALVNNLLREQGIHTLVQLSPRLFLPSNRQPAAETIDKCLAAIEARNDIMHARSTRGMYKLKQINPEQLNEHYLSLLAMYDVFVGALE